MGSFHIPLINPTILLHIFVLYNVYIENKNEDRLLEKRYYFTNFTSIKLLLDGSEIYHTNFIKYSVYDIVKALYHAIAILNGLDT